MKKIFLFAIVLIALVTFSSCKENGGKEMYTRHCFDYFDTVTSVSGYAESEEEFNAIYDEVINELREYHMLFTIYHRFDGMNNLCTVNELTNGEHKVVTVDRRIIEMLTYAKEMYELTNGKMNIAMGSVLSIWHEYRTLGIDDIMNARLPSEKELKDASLHTDIENLIIDEENSTVYISDPKMKLDVGAIAKGYAVEMIALALEENGVSGYVLNVGGNVRTIGTKPDGESWVVGIENPDENSDEPYLSRLKLGGESLVTSGSYQRFYIVDGKSYHHIIDGETLFPAELYTSVSVICKNSAKADALSTALFCMSAEDGLSLVNSLFGVEASWLLRDGTRIFSDGFSDYEK